jgi:hypothetical protein
MELVRRLIAWWSNRRARSAEREQAMADAARDEGPDQSDSSSFEWPHD